VHYFSSNPKDTSEDDPQNWRNLQSPLEYHEAPKTEATPEPEVSHLKAEAFSSGIEFKPGTAEIEEHSKQQLEKIYRYLTATPQEKITLLATDREFTDEELKNDLVYTRALAIKQYLVDMGIDASRIN